MKILITGGAGFIGSHIAQAYAAAGHDVAIVDDLSTGKKQRVPTGMRFYHADIRNAAQLTGIFEKEKPDVVNHHAAQASAEASVRDPVKDYEINVLGLINVLECSRKNGVKRIIFSSSAAVYGDKEPGKNGLNEQDALLQLSPYGASKMTSELYLRCYQNLYKIPFVILRYANVYGPHQDGGEAGVVPLFIRAMLAGKPCTIFGDGEQTRDYIFVDDIVAANVLALTKGENDVFNIGTGAQTSVNHLATMLKEIVGKGTTAHSQERPGDIRHSFLNSEKAKKVLDWHAEIPFKDGLKKTVEWFKKQE
ncbi:MAG: NAD-dependent epimerase/dehydratase family protein [Candidatus Woesearchaeota archaeon]|nr:NAD-dependent epimerase/dehydratase family protein [Candidatus Woesearchaeota archaeon]